MDKLANYGSDDDYDDSPKHRKMELPSVSDGVKRRGGAEEADVNYDEVQMDMSEDSDSSGGTNRERTGKRSSQHRLASPRHRERDNRERRRMEDYRRESKEKYRSSRDDRYKEKYSERDRRERNREDRSRRRSNSRERRRSNSRERRRSNSRERRRSNSRERRRSNSRERRRSNSRERRSRSPSRRNDYRNNKKSERKYDKFTPKVNLPIEKPQIEVQKPEITQPDKKFETEKDRFFMPGITGRFRDQIERRKLLWQKKEDPVKPTPASSTSTKVWQTTTFAQDADGKVASKFKRLMGIKEQSEQAKQATDVLKRQEEMFSSMEQQYEVARTATHTMRGVGLGFGSYQR